VQKICILVYYTISFFFLVYKKESASQYLLDILRYISSVQLFWWFNLRKNIFMSFLFWYFYYLTKLIHVINYYKALIWMNLCASLIINSFATVGLSCVLGKKMCTLYMDLWFFMWMHHEHWTKKLKIKYMHTVCTFVTFFVHPSILHNHIIYFLVYKRNVHQNVC
jgi:hypothetical protein